MSVEAGVLMRRTPSAAVAEAGILMPRAPTAAAEVGDPDAEDIGSHSTGQRFAMRRTSVATKESRGPRERRYGSGGEGRVAAATDERGRG